MKRKTIQGIVDTIVPLVLCIVLVCGCFITYCSDAAETKEKANILFGLGVAGLGLYGEGRKEGLASGLIMVIAWGLAFGPVWWIWDLGPVWGLVSGFCFRFAVFRSWVSRFTGQLGGASSDFIGGLLHGFLYSLLLGFFYGFKTGVRAGFIMGFCVLIGFLLGEYPRRWMRVRLQLPVES